MVHVAGAGALDEGGASHGTAVTGSQDPALRWSVGRGEPFHHHVRDDVRVLPEPEVVDPRGVVGPPAGGDDDGAHLQRERCGARRRGRWRRTGTHRRTWRTSLPRQALAVDDVFHGNAISCGR